MFSCCQHTLLRSCALLFAHIGFARLVPGATFVLAADRVMRRALKLLVELRAPARVHLRGAMRQHVALTLTRLQTTK